MEVLKKLSLITVCVALSACNTLDRLENVGAEPKLAPEKSPIQQVDYKPVSNWPTPVDPGMTKGANSLWQPGSRSFFKDQRATRIGDILTVVVNISDQATLNNSTTRDRTNTENLGAPQVFGLEGKIDKIFSKNANENNLLSLNGDSKSVGDGQIARTEAITTKVAASITQILPNGNMVIKGTQDIRVNYEMREVTVEGVIRPEDISADNTIASEQIAEARISYGGQGTVSDVQQPRYGNQIIDILSPF